MRRLIARLRTAARGVRVGTRAGDDQGAVGALVAILLSGGVLLGMGAIVIDVGRLYAEREQLQSGADAASWRVAEACIATPASCTNAGQLLNAQTYAANNANDGYADAQVCVKGISCPVWNTAVTCPALSATPGNYVEVRTTTRNSDGSTLLPPVLAGALAGQNYHGKQVGSCARVSWGPPATARTLALGISLCDWKRITGNGTGYFSVPLISPLLDQVGVNPVLGLTTATAGVEGPIVLDIPLGGSLTVCTTPLDFTVPRGYAWLGSPDSSCKISVTAPATLSSFVPFGATALNCATALLNLRNNHQAVLVPIFDQASGFTPLLGSFHVIGYAAFVFTGYTGLLGGLLGTVSWLGGGVPTGAPLLCGLANCIYGYFTRTLIPSARPVFSTTNPDYGVTVIGRTG